jgi:ribonuclease P protein component
MTARLTLGKAEKLKSRKSIDLLFKEGQRFGVGSIRVLYKPATQPGVRMGVGVSARVIKLAVKRNRIKRLLREAFRLQKATLQWTGATTTGLDLFFIYTASEESSFAILYEQMEKALTKLNQALASSSKK